MKLPRRDILRLALSCALFALIGFNALAMDTFLVERHDVREGAFRGFSVGMPRSAALQRMRDMSVTIATPIPHDDFLLTTDNPQDVKRIERAPGLRIRIEGGPEIELAFEDRKVVAIQSWRGAAGNEWFRVGEAVDDVINMMAEKLKSVPRMTAYPVVPTSRGAAVRVDGLEPGSERAFQAFDAWKFEVPSEKPAGAVFEVYFSGDRLERITYRRARVRLE